jgi:hypothetical protein
MPAAAAPQSKVQLQNTLQTDAGFLIAGFYEDYWNDQATNLNKYTPTFIATLALKHKSAHR